MEKLQNQHILELGNYYQMRTFILRKYFRKIRHQTKIEIINDLFEKNKDVKVSKSVNTCFDNLNSIITKINEEIKNINQEIEIHETKMV